MNDVCSLSFSENDDDDGLNDDIEFMNAIDQYFDHDVQNNVEDPTLSHTEETNNYNDFFKMVQRFKCETFFTNADAEACVSFIATREYASYELCKLFLNTMYLELVSENDESEQTESSTIQQKLIFYRQFILPLKTNMLWVYAYKLFVYNKVSFCERRMRDVESIVTDITHKGLRQLLICENRIQSQSFLQAWREWSTEKLVNPEFRLSVPPGFVKEFRRHCKHVHSTTTKKRRNTISPRNEQDEREFDQNKKKRILSLLKDLMKEFE